MPEAPRTVAVFTATRADAGPLGPVVAALGRSPRLTPLVIACGAHLDARRGRTLDALPVPEGTAVEVVGDAPRSSAPADLAATLGKLTPAVAEVLARARPDLLLVLGDRWELLAACGAALLAQVPVAHLHGGEVTEGALDDRVRHAVTKLADVHLCATDEARRRLLQLGEEPWRVHRVGAPALDRLAAVRPLDDADLADLLGRPVARPFGIVTYHPPTVDRGAVAARAEAVLAAAEEHLGSAVVTAPGADPGGDEILEVIDRVVGSSPTLSFVANLGARFPAVLAAADVMVGNSSSGITEAASFALPVVDVGDRQRGRPAPANVLRCGEGRDEVGGALRQALDPGFRSGLAGLRNPYGDGRSSDRIAEVLATVDLDRLARKRFVDLPLL